MNRFAKIKSVRTKDDFHLLIELDNDIVKEYDCHRITHRLNLSR